MTSGCSLDGAVKLNHGLTDIAVNWSGEKWWDERERRRRDEEEMRGRRRGGMQKRSIEEKEGSFGNGGWEKRNGGLRMEAKEMDVRDERGGEGNQTYLKPNV
jgi:hypothetical protein